MPPLPPLVETEWLAAHLADPDLQVVDCRWRGDLSSRALYGAGHLPGAVPLDWQHDFGETRDGVRDMLLLPADFAQLMASRGIGAETPVVAYAESDHSGAARLWWALRAYGHNNVAVLNGGFTKWQAERRPIETGLGRFAAFGRAGLNGHHADSFVSRPQPGWIATGEDVAAALHPGGPILIDTRPPEQYRGEAVWTPLGSAYLAAGCGCIDVGGRIPTRGGCIPGSRHWHALSLYRPGPWTFRPASELSQIAAGLGLTPDDSLITYCGGGISACAVLFALRLIGFPRVALYDGSWDEWGTDPERPIEVVRDRGQRTEDGRS